MKVKLYGTIISPPTRAVLMCAKALGVDLQLINIDLVASEQISEEFMKVNDKIYTKCPALTIFIISSILILSV